MEGTKGLLLLLQKMTSTNVHYTGQGEVPGLKEKGRLLPEDADTRELRAASPEGWPEVASGQGVCKCRKSQATEKEVRRCAGITDCAKDGAGSREKALEVRIFELH